MVRIYQNEMSKKKKAGLNTHEIKVQQSKNRQMFMGRIEALCDAMVGTEYFKLIPEEMLQVLYWTKYPALKAKAAPDAKISKVKVSQYNLLMNSFITESKLNFETGKSIPLRWYLSEGLALVNYILKMVENHFPEALQLKSVFADYFPGTDSHKWILETFAVHLHDANILLSELNVMIIRANMGSTACYDDETETNTVYIEVCKPESTSITIDNHKRKIIQLGWNFENDKLQVISIKPSTLGFTGTGSDNPIDVYVQMHVLDRLQERLDLTPGLMHFAIVAMIDQQTIAYVKHDNHSLVPYLLSNEKVGYLLVKWIDQKLIVVTFLFLTNDDTPEGKKLSKLLTINRLDKQHLKIDTLPAFNAYHIEDNDLLSKIFIEAGCGSLLKLRNLEEFTVKSLNDKDPESILKYLSDSKYFKGLDQLGE